MCNAYISRWLAQKILLFTVVLSIAFSIDYEKSDRVLVPDYPRTYSAVTVNIITRTLIHQFPMHCGSITLRAFEQDIYQISNTAPYPMQGRKSHGVHKRAFHPRPVIIFAPSPIALDGNIRIGRRSLRFLPSTWACFMPCTLFSHRSGSSPGSATIFFLSPQ